MSHPKALPTSLRIVAYFEIAFGTEALIEMLVQLWRGDAVTINLAVLCLPIGFGLLRLSTAWRTCCLVFCWFGIVTIPLGSLLALTSSSPAHVKLFGHLIGETPPVWIAVLAVPIFGLVVYQIRVLMLPDIRALFLNASARPVPPNVKPPELEARAH